MTTPLLETYQTLLVLSERQRQALEADAFEDYLEATEHREQAFRILLAQEAQSADLAPDERQAVQAIIPRILDNDARLEALILEVSGQTREELSTIQTGLNALHSYIQQPENREAFFIDRNS